MGWELALACAVGFIVGFAVTHARR